MTDRTLIALCIIVGMALFVAVAAFLAWRRSPERQARLRTNAYFREERAWQARSDSASSPDQRS